MKAILLAVALFLSTSLNAFAADVPVATLQAIVQRADEQQARALAQDDQTVMRDTATDDHYRQLVQINRGLARNGVTAIELLEIEWGPASVDGDSAKVTAYETWRTTYADGTTEESRDRNDYTLVQTAAGWKISADEHPDEDVMRPAPGSVPGTTPPNQPVPAGPGQSRNWSGYAATGGNFTSVTGTWTVPQATTAGPYAADAAWVGIGGVDSRDLIQAGTSAEVAGNGRVRYQAWVEMLPAGPHPIPLAVKPGDSVTFTVAETSPNEWLISAKNNTTGRSTSVREQYTSSHSSAEWVEEAPAAGGRRILPLTDFGTVQFTAGSVVKDGRTITIGGANAESVTMIDAAGRPIAAPSAIGEDGASFTVTRVSQPPFAAAPAPTSGTWPATPGARPGRGRGGRGFGG
jgi:hypothetical protein